MDNSRADQRLYGFYRAEVVDNKDPEKYGRVIVWIPAIMPEIEPTKGLWARPANNPLGGRNKESDKEHYYMGSSYIPKKGSWVLIFFESGNINNPYYFCGLDLENTKVLPENQLGSNYEDKWTVIKTSKGRCITLSDDPDDERVEITGKKRKISEPPTGDLNSVYTIDTNQTTILLDERSGKEKLLVRTYLGDFLHIDIDQRNLQAYFANDIVIEAGRDIHITAGRNIRVEANDNIFTEAVTKQFHMKSGLNMFQDCGADMHTQAANNMNIEAGSQMDQKSGSIFNQESGAAMNIKSGADLNQESSTAMNIKSGAALFMESGAILNIKSGAILNLESAAITNITAGAAFAVGATAITMLSAGPVAITGAMGGMSASAAGMEMESSGSVSIKAVGPISLDGSLTNEQCGLAGPATPATPSGAAAPASPASPATESDDSQKAKPIPPEGDRNT